MPSSHGMVHVLWRSLLLASNSSCTLSLGLAKRLPSDPQAFPLSDCHGTAPAFQPSQPQIYSLRRAILPRRAPRSCPSIPSLDDHADSFSGANLANVRRCFGLRSRSIAYRYGQYSETSKPPRPCIFCRTKEDVLRTL